MISGIILIVWWYELPKWAVVLLIFTGIAEIEKDERQPRHRKTH